ncbi:EF-hand domain-containing protein [Marinobacter halodurans]|uniref:EF-hand domain-containing protein n=1 Tax=Marinobacter halodurans TaxID=2528979 RepID=UPI0013F16898|nr:EF-hand domain-containing protein [Marinobacter halodurans]
MLAAPAVWAGSMSQEGSSHADRKESGMAHGKGKAMQTMHEDFDALDANSDGVISEDELNVYGNTAAGTGDSEAERNRMMLKARDRNQDGKITRGEFQKGADAEKPSDMQQ